MLFDTYYTPDDCLVIPTIQISLLTCEECDKTHGWQVQFMWLLWGLSVIYVFDDPQEQEI